MCGILGVIGSFKEDAFAEALGRLSHRGPDGFGIWNDATVGLRFGHRRLSILDLSEAGKQPMTIDDLTITYNGEIYNYRELRRDLELRGHKFYSHTDTEVILRSYQEWGEKCLTRFNGMWSFAIYDASAKTLFLTRDRFGVKPLFYCMSANSFSFASEMKALAPLLPEIELSKSFHWCKEHIYEYETSEHTLIESIKRFPAGHYAIFKLYSKTLTFSQYWNTLENLEEVSLTYEQQVEKFRSLFLDACRLRMRADVRVGTALSGGLDSSAVAAAMNFCGRSNGSPAPEWQNAFVATFPGTELDETEYAKSVVDHLELKGHYYNIDSVQAITKLDNYLWYFEELYDTSPVPMVDIYKAIKSNGVTVSLDGHGADELLSGYGNHLFNAVKDAPFNLRLIKEVVKTQKALRGSSKSDWETFVDGFSGNKNLIQFYLNHLLPSKKTIDPLTRKLGFYNGGLYRDFHLTVLPTLLRNYDRYSMAASVEVRMPFMDYRLVTFAFSLPWTSKLKRTYTKSILRDAVSSLLPAHVVYRKTKTGFSTPFTNWFRGCWKEFILDLVASNQFKQSNVIDPSHVALEVSLFYKQKSPSLYDGVRLWKALMPYLWEESFFKKLNQHQHV